MASSTGAAHDAATPPGGPSSPQPGPVPGTSARRPGSIGFATASLVAGVAGFTLVVTVPGVVFGLLGLRRARRHGWRGRGSGLARSCAGIALSLLWATAGAVLVPHLIRATDPGCTAYKGTGLTAYKRVITDLNSGGTRARLSRDLSTAITRIDSAAGRSRSAATARSISQLSHQLREMLTDLRDGRVLPDAALHALNRDSARADAACGTLRV